MSIRNFSLNNETGKVECRCGLPAVQLRAGEGYMCGSVTAYPCKFSRTSEEKTKHMELKHAAAYLPYNVKYLITEYSEWEEPKVYIDEAELIGEDLITFKKAPDWYFDEENDHEIKIVLRPLSDLTKEIEHNGEKVVLIEEIAKIECPNIENAANNIHSITPFNRGFSFYSRQKGVTYKYEGVTVEITHFKDAIFHKRVTRGNNSWVFSYFHNYPDIIQKLLEYHFDIFGLLEKGEAVDINTLNK